MKRMVGKDHVDRIKRAVITGGRTGTEATALHTSAEMAPTRNWKVLSRFAYRRQAVTMIAQKRNGAAL
jgi:hypothetical protein